MPQTQVPEAVFREIALSIDPVDPEECATDPTFRAIVTAGYTAGQAESTADALMSARDDLVGVADRLRAKARESGDKTHHGTAAGVSLACFRLVELADRAGRPLLPDN